MVSQILVKRKQYKLFTDSRAKAKKARRQYPQLKHARITHILQARPDLVRLNTLYDWDGIAEVSR